MGKIQNSKKNMIFSLFSHVILLVIGLFIPKITIESYGSDVNGLLTSVTQMIAYLALFEAGIQAAASHSLYKTVGEHNSNGTNAILAAVNKNYKKIGALYAAGLLFLSILYAFFVKIDSVSGFGIFAIVFFSGFGNVISFFYQGKYKILLNVEGKSYLFTNLNLVVSLISYVVKFVLLYNRVNVSIIIVASFLISMIQVVYIKFYVDRHYKWIDLNAVPNFVALKQSKGALVHQVSSMIFSNTDVVLLTVFCDMRIVSVYSMYKYITSSVNGFLSIPIDSCSFAMGQIFNVDRNKYRKYADMIDVIYGGLVFATYAAVSPMIIPFLKLYTANVTDVNYLNPVVAFLIVVVELLNHMRNPMLHAINFAGHFKETIPQTLIESSINLILSIVGVILFGVPGVLLGTVVALLYRTVDVIVYANRKLLDRSPLKTFVIYLFFAAVLVVLFFGYSALNIAIDSFFAFVCVGFCLFLCCCLVYLLCIVVFFREEYKLGKTFGFSLIKEKLIKK